MGHSHTIIKALKQTVRGIRKGSEASRGDGTASSINYKCLAPWRATQRRPDPESPKEQGAVPLVEVELEARPSPRYDPYLATAFDFPRSCLGSQAGHKLFLIKSTSLKSSK